LCCRYAEVYPTSVRATAMGVGNGFARIGGMTCPLFAVAGAVQVECS
jgi:hypothetical protein